MMKRFVKHENLLALFLLMIELTIKIILPDSLDLLRKSIDLVKEEKYC